MYQRRTTQVLLKGILIKMRIPKSLGTRIFIGFFYAPGGTRTPARRGLGIPKIELF